jgi:hypothetical protein
MAIKKIVTDFETDYVLVGVATSLREYKFCYHLNKLLGYDFIKQSDLVFESGDRSRDISFSVFRGESEENTNTFRVFSNKALGELLLPEMSGYDYIIQISGKFTDEESEQLTAGIKQFPETVLCAVIPPKKIRNHARLIYEEEKTTVKPRIKRNFL